ncbi:Ig-like domain-containing protein [Candidatus Woesebacteria bacterium]|nr:Ig-like domain-containing protein [Candidatus Woesebacteria bacterium]
MRSTFVQFICFLCFFFLIPSFVNAATIYVDSSTGNDSTGDGSSGTPYKTFHKGYTSSSAGDTIDLTGTFTWADADETGDTSTSGYTIGKNLTIQGQTADTTILQAASSDNTADRRIFSISSGVTATINDLTMRYGKVTGSTDEGGAVYNLGTVTANRVSVYNNRVPSGYGGGGFANRDTMTINDSTIYDNVVNYMGGGVLNSYYVVDGGYLTITNSTIFSNDVTAVTAYTEGGGVHFRQGNGTITNSTIAYNSACGVGGVGMDDNTGTVIIKNSILVSNVQIVHAYCSNGVYPKDFGYRQSGYGNVTDNGYNIVGATQHYTFTGTGDWTDANRDGTFVLQTVGTTGSLYLNSSLADNGSINKTQTLALTDESSIAVDNGATGTNGSVSVPTLDQRGLARVSDTDIGAYEYGATADSTPPTISTLSPTDGETAIAVDANLVVTFDEAVAVQSGNLTIFTASDDAQVEAIDVTSGQVTGTGSTTITINPSSDLTAETAYYVKIDATAFDDTAGNSFAGISDTTTWNFTTVDVTAPTISSVSSMPSSTSAVITWTTNESASSQVQYGLVTSYGYQTTEADTSPRVTSHSVTVSSLLACRRYYYRVKSTDAESNQASSSQSTFTTTGCDVAPIQNGSEQNITRVSGGEFQLTNSNSVAKLTVPTGFASEDADFQINKLSTTGLPAAPSGTALVDSNVFDLSAVTSSNTDLTSFLKSLTFTVTYGSDTETSFQESTLDVYKYNTGIAAWEKKNCTLDVATNSLTCSLTSFSTYAVYGDPVSSSSSSGSSSGSSSSPTIGCSDLAPPIIPDLFQIDTTQTTATVYFSPSTNMDWYFISFSTQTHAEEHGAFVKLGHDGVQNFTVTYLSPGTQYFFKVRAQQGCMPGVWSQIIPATTKPLQPTVTVTATPQPIIKGEHDTKHEKPEQKIEVKKEPRVIIITPTPQPTTLQSFFEKALYYILMKE